MNKSKSIMSVFTLFALGVFCLNAQAQQSNRLRDRQVTGVLQRLERSSTRYRSSLNLALVNGHIDETRPQNDINSFEPAFAAALDRFKEGFDRRTATAGDVQEVLQKASIVNGFMARNRLNLQVQNDWTSVRTDLNALASAYSVSWQWNQPTPLPMSSSRSLRLSESELNQLIRRITAGGDSFRASLTAAFDRNSYNQSQGERDMLVAVGYLRNATDRLRNEFDAKRPLTGYVAPVLTRATSIDTYMSNNELTPRAQTDWSTLRAELDTLAGAYNLSTNWQAGSGQRSAQAGYGSNGRLTGTF